MYKVFVNDKPLFLTNHISKETDFQLFLLESIDIEQLIVKIFQNKINKAYLYHPDEKEAINFKVAEALRDKKPYKITCRLLKKDGTFVWVDEYGEGVIINNKIEFDV